MHIIAQEERFILHVVLRLQHIGQRKLTNGPPKVLECLFNRLSGPRRLVSSQSLAKSSQAVLGGHVVMSWAVAGISSSRSSNSCCWSLTRGQPRLAAGPDLYSMAKRRITELDTKMPIRMHVLFRSAKRHVSHGKHLAAISKTLGVKKANNNVGETFTKEADWACRRNFRPGPTM